MKLHGKMVAVLDLIAGGNSIAEAARRLDIVSRTIFYWIQRSRNGHEKMVIEWGEWGSAPFHKHLDSAQAMAIALMRSEAESNSTIGFEEVVIFQGQVQYKLDPRKVGLDDDMCILLFGDTDRFLRNEKGEAIPLTVKRKPPRHSARHSPRCHQRSMCALRSKRRGVPPLQGPCGCAPCAASLGANAARHTST